VRVKVTKAERDQVERLATARGEKTAVIVKQAIYEYLLKHKSR
jgi:hypothetical protein